MGIQRIFERSRKERVRDVDFERFLALAEELGFSVERLRAGQGVFLRRASPQAFPLRMEPSWAKSVEIRRLLQVLEKHAFSPEAWAAKDFCIQMFWNDEYEFYVADIPDLFPCTAFGRAPELALAEVLLAKEAWFGRAHEKGLAVPQPADGPVAGTGGES